MKNFYNNILIAAGALMVMVTIYACTDNNYDIWKNGTPGYLVNIVSSESYVSGTFDLGTRTIDYDSVHVYVAYEFPPIKTKFDRILVRKKLFSQSDELLATGEGVALTETPANVEVSFETISSLFENVPFPQDSLKPGYYFQINTIMFLENGDSVTATSGNYNVTLNLSGFCPLPVVRTGIWTARNNGTSFTKDVIIRNPSPFVTDDEGRYWLSDFGLDWSTWNDVWYSLEFKLECPRGDNPNQYFINLMPEGNYDTGTALTSTDRSGSSASKTVRVMPYQYKSDTEAYGYYDAETEQIVFKNVSVVDSWWNTDNHTVDLIYKYKGPE